MTVCNPDAVTGVRVLIAVSVTPPHVVGPFVTVSVKGVLVSNAPL
jgi:hypothetical protein